ncbi:hypothetical protein O6H91_18G042700 [Diphasiastrum complanatum]|uniref:Uncharacterized protein n=1 Tax=Diphasiastrum complanatum TaxID=34168 RepID=A0ACC2B1A7_DIPCM|nr:hypothetical protein O6H91_18G042700 [Diphasiastrum complanatum]
MEGRALMWFRKGLRLHDNPALEHACEGAKNVYAVFVLDPWFLAPDPCAPSPGSARVGINRIQFLLGCLKDLDLRLKSRGNQLLLLHGNPVEIIPGLLHKWSIKKLCFEYDTEPYSLQRDNFIKEHATETGVEVCSPVSHTIYNPEDIIAKNGGMVPLTYQSFCRVLGKPSNPLGDGPSHIPPPIDYEGVNVLSVPCLEDLGYKNLNEEFSPFPGGETEGLKRLEESLKDKNWVSEFEKPKGDPTAFMKPATTVLSPYLKFGCVSSRLFYSRLKVLYSQVKSYTKPPVSLEGQLLWREFFYTVGYGTPNFDRMVGSPICKQIPWKDDEDLLAAWRDGHTGYPWIDAAMVQLRKWGWMHHLARHAVACFLTRGDMFVHWEKGRDVFDRLLIDDDWSINNGNWLWLSASAFFAQYHRIYSPITFGQKYDPEGKFVKYFLPVLQDIPKQYIYAPWKAPDEVQKNANCIIGKDYPYPMDHVVANKACRECMAAAYQLNKDATGKPTAEQLDLLKVKFGQSGNFNVIRNSKSSPSVKRQRQSKLTEYK